jgi:hypothetical protein
MEEDASQLEMWSPTRRYDVAAWKQIIARDHSLVREGASSGDVSDISGLTREFHHMARRLSTQLATPVFRQNVSNVIKGLGETALGLSMLLHSELTHAGSSDRVGPPLGVLHALSSAIADLVHRLDGQLWLLGSTESHAEQLHSVADDLLRNPKTASAHLRNLASRIMVEQAESVSAFSVIPESGVRTAQLVRSRHRESESVVYANGIQAARMVVCGVRYWFELTDAEATIVMAALIRDIGFLVLEDAWGHAATELVEGKSPGFTKHIELGTALSAGVEGVGAELSQLVAQHHERSDGSGFPHGITIRRMSKASCLLQICIRFVEILDCCMPRTDDLIVEDVATVHLSACAQILREARRGELDLVGTRRFLDGVAPGLQEQAESLSEGPDTAFSSDLAVGGVQLHTAHRGGGAGVHGGASRFADTRIPQSRGGLSRPRQGNRPMRVRRPRRHGAR